MESNEDKLKRLQEELLEVAQQVNQEKQATKEELIKAITKNDLEISALQLKNKELQVKLQAVCDHPDWSYYAGYSSYDCWGSCDDYAPASITCKTCDLTVTDDQYNHPLHSLIYKYRN